MKPKSEAVKQHGQAHAGGEQRGGSNPRAMGMGMMKSMMEKMMTGVMGPKDMPPMMNAMMEKMFSSMSVEDRKEFVTSMMPNCVKMMFAELNSSSKEKLAREILEKMIAVLKEQFPDPEK